MKAETRPRPRDAAWHREPAAVADLYDGCLSFPVWAEPKVDGVRAVACLDGEGRVSIRSRAGIVYECPRIAAELSRLIHPSSFSLQPCILDGEISGVDFARTLSGIESGYDEGLRFHVWDALTFDEWAGVQPQRARSTQRTTAGASGQCRGEDLPSSVSSVSSVVSPPLSARHQRIAELLPRDGQRVSGHFRLGLLCRNEREAEAAFLVFRNSGYEGAVYKKLAAPYGEGWFRRKGIDTVDAPIVGVEEGRGRLAGTVGAVLVEVAGAVVRIGSGLSDDVRRSLWELGERARGQVVEFRLEAAPANGRPAPAVFVRMRPDKAAVS